MKGAPPAGPVVLVTDADQRAALASVRSLGRAGYQVHVCSCRARAIAGASRFSRSETRVPDPLREPDAYASDVGRLVQRLGAAVLLPISEPSLLALLPHRESLACTIPFPSIEQFTAICDKALVLARAREHGIATPRQQIVHTAAEGTGIAAGMRYPIVLKPSRSVSGPAANRMKTSVLYAANDDELRCVLERLDPATYPILLQERIIGPGIAISLLVWQGTLRAAFAHRRLREKPPSGGVSVLREGIPIDRALLERSLALLASFAWQGVAMVEFKVDEPSGIPYLMEINGRLWGSLQLAIDSGIDFPVMLAEAACGRPPVRLADQYPAGVRTRWELGDVDHLLAMLRRSRASLHLPAGAPGRWRAIGGFLGGFGPGIHHEVLQRDDPGPFLRELRGWLSGT